MIFLNDTGVQMLFIQEAMAAGETAAQAGGMQGFLMQVPLGAYFRGVLVLPDSPSAEAPKGTPEDGGRSHP